MSFFSRNTAVLALSLTALLTGMSSFAATKPVAKSSSIQKVSMLDGKFAFSLPTSYVATPMSDGTEKTGTAGTTGTMYANKDEKRVILTAERTLPGGISTGDNDDVFLDGSVADFVRQQSAALPDFKQTSENRLTVKGLGIREIDSTATMGGGHTLNATFLSGSGTHAIVVQVISRADDQAGHAALIKRIIAGLNTR
jgi:hypothetical protein